MKRLLLIFAALAIILPIGAEASPGWQRDTTWTWSYEPPLDLTLAGFRMYQDGNPVCEYSLPEARTAACKITLVKKTTSFTLTAFFSDGRLNSINEIIPILRQGLILPLDLP